MNYKLLKQLKILLVEDEKKLLGLLKEAINEYFACVATAKDGVEGLKKFKTVKPDIVITDIMMPLCDGLEMTKKIKELDEQIPIIILSAHSDKEKLLQCIDLGISKYFIKPFDIEDLLAHIDKIALKIPKKSIIKLRDNFLFNPQNLNLYKDENLIILTKREKEFFNLLLKNKNEIVSAQKIKDLLWEEEVNDERLRTFIKRLRLKTSKDLVENISSQGYLISVEN